MSLLNSVVMLPITVTRTNPKARVLLRTWTETVLQSKGVDMFAENETITKNDMELGYHTSTMNQVAPIKQ
jgi:hypothetical protein